jgi:hypothetical protein
MKLRRTFSWFLSNRHICLLRMPSSREFFLRAAGDQKENCIAASAWRTRRNARARATESGDERRGDGCIRSSTSLANRIERREPARWRPLDRLKRAQAQSLMLAAAAALIGERAPARAQRERKVVLNTPAATRPTEVPPPKSAHLKSAVTPPAFPAGTPAANDATRDARSSMTHASVSVAANGAPLIAARAGTRGRIHD